MKRFLAVIATCVAPLGCGSSSATTTTRAATPASVASSQVGSGAVGCHADLTGDLTRSLDDAGGGVGLNSYWWPYDAKQPGTVAFAIKCDLIGFRVTNGTTTAQFRRGTGHYAIVDYTKRNLAGSTDGFWALDSGPGAVDMSIDVSLTAGSAGGAYVVATPGTFDITSFDQSTISGTFSVTLNAEPNGRPPVDPTKAIKVTGRFSVQCSPKGDPVHGDTSKDCK